MSKTRVEMIIETLRDNPHKKFTARDLAAEFLVRYPNEMAEKQSNPRYDTPEKLLAQLAAEIGGERTEAAKQRCANVVTQDKPRPRLYYWDANPEKTAEENSLEDTEPLVTVPNYSEQELYPLLIEFLHKELKLYCQRIDEKTSRNSHGSGGNHWLHPDIVALEPLDQHWDAVVKDCVRHGNDSAIRLWLFEVKNSSPKVMCANTSSKQFLTLLGRTLAT